MSSASCSMMRFNQDVIGCQIASFTWSNDDAHFTLTRQFNLRVHGELLTRGPFNFIVWPPVPAGHRTSLLIALLGEMHFAPMRPRSRRGVSYAAQGSWAENEAIRVRTNTFGF
jgi:hypothetical protein